MFRPLYILGHHQVLRLIALLTFNANFVIWLINYLITKLVNMVLV